MDLSIIVPIYNVEKYIIECLESIYQDNALSNFEVLCIDDCGNDESINLVKKYVRENKINNLKIIRHKKNGGLSAARNTGIKNASGKYLCLLDSDDMIKAKELKEAVDKAIANDLDILECNYAEVTETNQNIKLGNTIDNVFDENKVYPGKAFFPLMMEAYYTAIVWRRIYKKDYLKRKKLSFYEGLKFEDEEFTPRAIISADRIMHSNKQIYIYRRRDGSITTTKNKDIDWVNHYVKIIHSLSNFVNKVEDKQCLNVLRDRMGNLSLSIYKNAITYKHSKEDVRKIINIVRENKLYKYAIKAHKLFIKLQGIIMAFPHVFLSLYRMIYNRAHR